MHKASTVLAAGADFAMLGPDRTMIASDCPVISICAVRTGVGKSGISRYVWNLLREHGLRAVDIRHPMPYRDLTAMRAERYGSMEDLDRLGVTVEEREEYEPFIETGGVVMAGVDYTDILLAAEQEADVIIWDGGNNDMPFIRPDLEIVALDPHRPGHERLYHPGEVNFLRADVLVINKVDTADPSSVAELHAAAARFNPGATVIETDSTVVVSGGDARIAGKKVLVIEDGPTVTHGGMPYGAGIIAARRAGAVVVDPRPYAVGSLRDTFAAWTHLTEVLPAMGYSEEQLADLAATIAAVPCDAVLIATPIDLARLIDIGQDAVRVTYEVEDRGAPTLRQVVEAFLEERDLCDHGTE
jgi:predicted GTPase